MKEYSVYIHTNKENGKRYIGRTSTKPERRWGEGHGYLHCESFYADIQKYGWDGFYHTVVARGLSKAESCLLEKKLISEYKTTDSNYGYNTSIGGAGFEGLHHSDASKRQISETLQKYEFTADHKKHLSESKSGVKHHCAKKVFQYSKSGQLIKVWDYMNEAAKALGISKGNISAVCHGKAPSAGGFVWTYDEGRAYY